VKHEACTSEVALHRFYERQGRLLASLYLLAATGDAASTPLPWPRLTTSARSARKPRGAGSICAQATPMTSSS